MVYNKFIKVLKYTVANNQVYELDKLDALDDVPKLSAYEYSLIKELVDILILFNDATEFTQVEGYPSAGYMLPNTIPCSFMN